MSKAGKGDGVDTGTVGSQHPVPEDIPHLTSPGGAVGAVGNGPLHLQPHAATNLHHGGSPVKESSFLQHETSAEEVAKALPNANNATTA